MKNYHLIINGKEVETEQYKYFISIEEILKNPELAVYLNIMDLTYFKRLFLKRLPFIIRHIKKSPQLEFYRLLTKDTKIKNLNIKELEKKLKSKYYAKYGIASDQENLLAMKSAKEASFMFKNLDPFIRLKIAKSCVRKIKENKDSLKEVLIAEGHSSKLADFELDYLINNVLSDNNLDFLYQRLITTIFSDNDKLVYQPYGVFGVITPYNGPLIAASITIISSIISGNTCIIKPSNSFPLSTFELVKIISNKISDYKVHPGVINIIVGNSKEIVNKWINSYEVDGIIFFGASHHGINIAAQCFKKNKKVILELSGSDAVLVWKDADLDKACNDVIKSRFLASGQFCIAIKRAFIHRDVYQNVIKLLIKKVKELNIGLPSSPNVDQVPIGSVEMLRELKDVLGDAVSKGGKILFGGRFLNYDNNPCNNGFFLEPTILSNISMPMKVMNKEVFGPILPLINVNTIKESIDLINNSDYGLRASLWCKDKKIIDKFVAEIKAGSIIINAPHYFMGKYSTHLGGVKASGIGGAKYFTEEMCYKKFVHIE